MNWYVLFVETGKEQKIQKWIKCLFNEDECYSFVPKKLISERKNGLAVDKEKVLFPGYVFIYTDMSAENYYRLKTIPRFVRILKNKTCYSNVREYEIYNILRLTKDFNTIGYSKIEINNLNINVCDGPLKGMESLIKKIDKRKKRVLIELEFLNEKIPINLGIELITSNNT